MRKFLLICLTLVPLAGFCSDIEKLLKDKGCFSCHDLEKSKIGPSYKVISKEYKGKANAVNTLVKSITGGSVGKWQGLARKYGIKITAFYMPRQNVSREEAKKIAEWILSLEK
ncbi:MAG TPA: c-type cytochrome [Aquificaceae bacterium]|nr:c-type cytochrome [Aquificaceae bacterium]HIQ48432.1 c-type cytochrome [Aquifex aeolicus]